MSSRVLCKQNVAQWSEHCQLKPEVLLPMATKFLQRKVRLMCSLFRNVPKKRCFQVMYGGGGGGGGGGGSERGDILLNSKRDNY